MVEMDRRTLRQFDIMQIAASGQCFRMERTGDSRWEIPAHGRSLVLHQYEDRVVFDCPADEFENIWRPYFDLDTDYGLFIDRVDPADSFLNSAAGYGHGIRILRQELWETAVSFIISQNSNIARIRKIIAAMCRELGGQGGGFPMPQSLAYADLSPFRLGYREPYIKKFARDVCMGDVDLERIASMDDDGASAALKRIYGIGPKVADCILLFGMHRLDRVPMDTWMKKIERDIYGGSFPYERYRGFNGVMQQYMFYYCRELGLPKGRPFDNDRKNMAGDG